MRFWLILAILTPAVSMAFLAYQDYEGIQQTQRSADQLEADIERIADLRLLQVWLVAESALDSVQSGLAETGLDVDQLISLMDSSIELQATSDIRGVVDAAITKLHDSPSTGPSGVALLARLDTIDEIRERADTGTITGDEVRQYFDEVTQLTDTAAAMLVREATELNRNIGDPTLARWVDVLESLSAVMQARIDEVVNSSLVLTRFPGTEPHATAAAELVESNQRLDQAEARFRQTADAAVLRRYDEIHSTPLAQEYRELRLLVPAALGLVDTGDEPPPSLDGEGGTSIVLGGFSVLPNEANLLEEAKAQAQAQAAFAANQAESSQTQRLISLAAILIVALLLAALAGRSIGQPIQNLADRARRISAGDLDAKHDRPIQLPEAQAASRAFDELTASLQSFENQTDALARGAVDSPVFQQELPGSIGKSIQQSVRNVSTMTRRLQAQASTDALTGLANRSRLTTILDRALNTTDQPSDVGLIFVDLDRFKAVNDLYGHAAGDRVLQICASRLQAVCMNRGFVARIGGDEFVVVSRGVASAEPLLALVDEIVEAFREPFAIGDLQLEMSASFGLALAGQARSASDLLHDADLALYASKRDTMSITVCDDQLRQSMTDRQLLESALRRAIRLDELELHLQPVVDLATGRIVAAEALARWTDRGRIVSPAEFIAIAERSSLIIDLGQWALHRAADHARRLQEKLGQPIEVSVNVSWRHVTQGELLDDVRSAVESAGIDPRLLRIEVTETSTPDAIDEVSEVLHSLRDFGVGLSLDDFGTGHSSITHLRLFPFDSVKLDRSLIQTLHDPTERKVVDVVMQLMRTLGLSVVAEGIEQIDQQQRALDAGAHRGQGYLWGRAAPIDQFIVDHRSSCARIG